MLRGEDRDLTIFDGGASSTLSTCVVRGNNFNNGKFIITTDHVTVS